MSRQEAPSWNIAVIGAGIIGACVAYALSREGRRVCLVDLGPPGFGGASFGNAAHLAAELVEPLPSRALLWGFWRKLFVLGGPLDIPVRRIPHLLPWLRGFAAASACQAENTTHLAPLVRSAVADMQRWCIEIGRPDLVRTHGHYEVWFGPRAARHAELQVRAMERLQIPTSEAPSEWLRSLDPSRQVQGVHFRSTGHVTDPLQVLCAFVEAARQRGTHTMQSEVRALVPSESGVWVQTSDGEFQCSAAVVCAGAWSAPLLQPLGVPVPLAGVRGYHIELPGEAARVDAPIVYADDHVVVTPLQGRLRASSFMDFVELDAAHDARKRTRLIGILRRLGYDCRNARATWAGPRPVFPDYLPGLGRVPGTNVYYAVGHQHIGLTLAPVTGELMADLIAAREPRREVRAFDLQRFGIRR